jgi:hypothetical protein
MTDKKYAPKPNEKRPSADPSSSLAEKKMNVERREILSRLGKLAAITPPTIITLMMTTRSAAAS